MRYTAVMALIIGCTGVPDVQPVPTCGAPGDTFTAGMVLQGTTFSVTLIDADPAPPDRGVNNWVLQITDDGTSVTSLDVQISPFMPEHGHGTSPLQFDAEVDGDTFLVGPMDLFMSGLWEFTVTMDDGVSTDEVVWTFCVEG
jgi:hypothetical protein